MLQGNALYGKAAILKDDLMLGCVDGMEHHLELQSRAEHIHLCLQHRPERSRRIDMQCSCAPQHAESGDEPDEPEAMVAMKVGDKNRLNLCEAYTGATQLYLRALATVYHKKLSAYLHDLRRGEMLQCRQRTATSKDMNIE